MALGDRETVTVGENTFFILPFPPFVALKNLATLQKYVLPIIGKLAGGISAKPDILEMDTEKTEDIGNILSGLDGALNEIASRLDAESADVLLHIFLDPEYISVKDPATSKTVKLTAPVINQIFTRQTFLMVQLAAAVVKVNYADFFARFKSHIGRITG